MTSGLKNEKYNNNEIYKTYNNIYFKYYVS